MKTRILGMLIPLLLIAVPASAQIPNPLRKAKELLEQNVLSLSSLLEAEPPLSTSLDHAIGGVSYLDDYEPSSFRLWGSAGVNSDGTITLEPGAYEYVAQSYCLKPGGYRPQGSPGYFGEILGDYGYLDGPFKGTQAEQIERILRHSTLHPDIEQRDIQVLLWAIIARTKIADMSHRMQLTAARLLTPEDLLELEGNAITGDVTDDLLDEARSQLPTLLFQVLEAKAKLRSMLTAGEESYEEIERVAVRVGVPPPMDDGASIPPERWSYHPNGYFVRYAPNGYSRTGVQIVVPDQVTIERDGYGRIVKVSDHSGDTFDVHYDDTGQPVQVPGDNEVSAYHLTEITLSGGSGETTGLASGAWVLAGVPAGDGRTSEVVTQPPGLPERYAYAVKHAAEWSNLIERATGDERDSFYNGLRDLVDLSQLRFAVDGAFGEEFLTKAWLSSFCELAGPCEEGSDVGAADHPGSSRAVRIASGPALGEDDPAYSGPVVVKRQAAGQRSAGPGIALPANPGSQRIGVSLRDLLFGEPAPVRRPILTRPITYDSPDAAARAALNAVNSRSVRENLEYAGWIYKKDGRYSFTDPEQGWATGGNEPAAPPLGTTKAGYYHTHGDYNTLDPDTGEPVRTDDPSKDDYDSDNFSPNDKSRARETGVPWYLGTPGGTYRRYDPSTGRDTELRNNSS